MSYSVNCCTKCKRNINLAGVQMGFTLCAECHYLSLKGIHTIEQYNKYLKEIQK